MSRTGLSEQTHLKPLRGAETGGEKRVALMSGGADRHRWPAARQPLLPGVGVGFLQAFEWKWPLQWPHHGAVSETKRLSGAVTPRHGAC